MSAKRFQVEYAPLAVENLRALPKIAAAHYLDLLEARAQNFGKRRYSTEQVKKMLQFK